jgi:hypothetical protein
LIVPDKLKEAAAAAFFISRAITGTPFIYGLNSGMRSLFIAFMSAAGHHAGAGP